MLALGPVSWIASRSLPFQDPPLTCRETYSYILLANLRENVIRYLYNELIICC
jgi:hypothetical protein